MRMSSDWRRVRTDADKADLSAEFGTLRPTSNPVFLYLQLPLVGDGYPSSDFFSAQNRL